MEIPANPYDSAGAAVAIMDLLHFRDRINIPYGHVTGDQVLMAIGQRLQDGLAPRRVFRYGGDEFLLEIAEALSETGIANLADQIAALVGAPIEGIDKPVEVRIGFSRDRVGSDLRTVEIQADQALFRASKRNVLYQVWSPELMP